MFINGSALRIDVFIPKNEIMYNRASNVYMASDMAATWTLIWLVNNLQLLVAHVNMMPKSVHGIFMMEALKPLLFVVVAREHLHHDGVRNYM